LDPDIYETVVFRVYYISELQFSSRKCMFKKGIQEQFLAKFVINSCVARNAILNSNIDATGARIIMLTYA
jgi:hypothetical protein